jgi:hypothetical protein
MGVGRRKEKASYSKNRKAELLVVGCWSYVSGNFRRPEPPLGGLASPPTEEGMIETGLNGDGKARDVRGGERP